MLLRCSCPPHGQFICHMMSMGSKQLDPDASKKDLEFRISFYNSYVIDFLNITCFAGKLKRWKWKFVGILTLFRPWAEITFTSAQAMEDERLFVTT